MNTLEVVDGYGKNTSDGYSIESCMHNSNKMNKEKHDLLNHELTKKKFEYIISFDDLPLNISDLPSNFKNMFLGINEILPQIVPYLLDELEKDKLERILRKYKERNKLLHDEQKAHREFVIGQKVWLYNTRLRFFSGKITSKWSGP